MSDGADRTYPGLARFEPNLDAMAHEQRALWPRLAELPADAVLYGGSGIAVRLGHRVSIDFDLFLPRSFAPGDMAREIARIGQLDVMQSAPNTLSARVDGVGLSLFGVQLSTIAAPSVTSDIGLPAASPRRCSASDAETVGPVADRGSAP